MRVDRIEKLARNSMLKYKRPENQKYRIRKKNLKSFVDIYKKRKELAEG